MPGSGADGISRAVLPPDGAAPELMYLMHRVENALPAPLAFLGNTRGAGRALLVESGVHLVRPPPSLSVYFTCSSLSRMIWLTTWGDACPLSSRMTCPTRKPKAFSFPAR